MYEVLLCICMWFVLHACCIMFVVYGMYLWISVCMCVCSTMGRENMCFYYCVMYDSYAYMHCVCVACWVCMYYIVLWVYVEHTLFACEGCICVVCGSVYPCLKLCVVSVELWVSGFLVLSSSSSHWIQWFSRPMVLSLGPPGRCLQAVWLAGVACWWLTMGSSRMEPGQGSEVTDVTNSAHWEWSLFQSPGSKALSASS